MRVLRTPNCGEAVITEHNGARKQRAVSHLSKFEISSPGFTSAFPAADLPLVLCGLGLAACGGSRTLALDLRAKGSAALASAGRLPSRCLPGERLTGERLGGERLGGERRTGARHALSLSGETGRDEGGRLEDTGDEPRGLSEALGGCLTSVE